MLQRIALAAQEVVRPSPADGSKIIPLTFQRGLPQC
jgi:hypothetical protein